MNAEVLRQRRRSIERESIALSRYPLQHGRTAGIAAALGLSETSVRRERTQPKGCSKLQPLLNLILTADDETAMACVATVVAAWEDRVVLRATDDVLCRRTLHLWHRAEPAADVEEDRRSALYLGGGCREAYADALVTSGAVQLELRAHVVELDDRGVDVRALLVGAA